MKRIGNRSVPKDALYKRMPANKVLENCVSIITEQNAKESKYE